MRKRIALAVALATATLLPAIVTTASAETGYRYIPQGGSAAKPQNRNWNGRTYTDEKAVVQDCETSTCTNQTIAAFNGRQTHESRDRAIDALHRGDLLMQKGNRADACNAYRKAQSLLKRSDDSALAADADTRAAEACAADA